MEAATTRGEAQTLKESGNECFKRGEYGAALELFTAALAVAGQEDGAALAILHCNRATCHAQLGQHAEAIADAKRALALDGKYQTCL